MRGSCRFSLISRVYSSSIFCGAFGAVFCASRPETRTRASSAVSAGMRDFIPRVYRRSRLGCMASGQTVTNGVWNADRAVLIWA